MLRLKKRTKNKKLIIGNWKMNKSLSDSVKTAKSFVSMSEKLNLNKNEIVICPNFVALAGLQKVFKKTNIKLGAQNVFWDDSGAYTGEVDVLSLIEVGCKYVIIGHSERRKYMFENDNIVNLKLKTVLKTKKITPIICIGETAVDKEKNRRDSVLINQIKKALKSVDITDEQEIIIAYEPIWAIGSGETIKPQEAVRTHKIIKKELISLFGKKIVEANFRIIYGGSVNSENVASFKALENIDGFLIGTASLDAEQFYKICKLV